VPLVACCLSALLIAASLPPIGLSWLSGVALLPLLRSVRKVSAVRAVLLGAVFGGATGLVLSHWLVHVVIDRFSAAPLAAVGLVLLVSATAAPATAIFALVARSVPLSSPLYAPTLGAAWACMELFLARAWPGLPWLVLGAPLIDSPLAPLASTVGVHGVSALAAASAAFLIQLRLFAWVPLCVGGAVAIAATAALLSLAPALRGPPTSLRISLVQPGLSMSARRHPSFQQIQLERLLALSPGRESADLVVWPESAFVQAWDTREHLRQRMQRHFQTSQPPLLAGGFSRRAGGLRTAIFYFAHAEKPRVVYEKRRIVPLAEEVPGWLPEVMRAPLGRLLPVQSLTRGRGPVGAIPFELSLCFEAAFSDRSTAPEAPLLINLANDGWYDDTAAAAHHMLLVRWRALEAGAPLVRAATTGISAFVAPNGRVIARIGVRKSGHLTRTLELQSRITLFERHGYAPLASGSLLLALWHVGCFLRRCSPRETMGKHAWTRAAWSRSGF
jgi:apolipoprotein N-acyltransferase